MSVGRLPAAPFTYAYMTSCDIFLASVVAWAFPPSRAWAETVLDQVLPGDRIFTFHKGLWVVLGLQVTSILVANLNQRRQGLLSPPDERPEGLTPYFDVRPFDALPRDFFALLALYGTILLVGPLLWLLT
ncbi:hypothetical protein [Brevundimonas poindexterae]|uniref:hypothetical protein n=1 Tax=Brevundimonas poindexterae TaxID=74325 RepID=UPI001CFD6699|nr:hypothetical protein [Brevundimonas poindexterae]